MKTKTPAWVMEELQKAQKAKSNGGRRTSTVIPATSKNNTLKRTATSPAHLVTGGGSEKKMLSKDMQIKLLRTKVERLNHRIEELMAIAANKTRTVKRQKNEIEALRIDLARRSTGSMPHDDLVDEIDRLNQAIAAYKIGEEPDPDLIKTRPTKTSSGRSPRHAATRAGKKDVKQSKWRKELNPQSLEGGNTWGTYHSIFTQLQ